MRKLLPITFLLSFTQVLFGQDVRIYHGERSGSVFLKQTDKLENSSRESVKIIRASNGIVTIHILNPNPFFYNYEIKTEDVDIKDDYSDQFAELVKLINALPDLITPTSSPFAQRTVPMRPAHSTPTTFDTYQASIVSLDQEIKKAKGYIETSDRAETIHEAFDRVDNSRGYGFRTAVGLIMSQPSGKYQFNSKSLEKDLNELLDKSITDGSFANSFGITGNDALISVYTSAFKGLNKQFAATIKEILKVTEKDTIMRFQIPVKENKETKVKIVITKINDEDNVARELLNEEVAKILPFYLRKRFEVVPVVNLTFQSNRQRFSIENDLVKSLPDDDAKFNIGAMALMNFTSFGEFKEYGVGLGLGYSIQPGGKSSSFFAIPSLSYKDIFRIGFGFGYNMTPVGLKNGAKVDAPLPSDISNIEDVIEYRRKPAAVISIAISGIKF